MIIEAIMGSVVPLGRIGENEARIISFDVSDLLSQFPNATITLLNKRPLDPAAYPVSTSSCSMEGDRFFWNVQNSDIAQTGTGLCELIAQEDSAVLKSYIYTTFTDKALDGSGDPPEPWKGWVEEVLEAAEEAKSAASILEHPGAEAVSVGPEEPAEVTYIDGVFSFKIPQGERGEQGAKGDPGSKGDPGERGESGQDGVSPTASVSKSGNTSTLTVTDSNGTTTVDILDGVDGHNGADGQDGFSPLATVTKSGTTATITVTDKTGTTTTTISDGATGESGVYYGTTEPIDPEQKVWINPNGEPNSEPQWELIKSAEYTTASEADIEITTDSYGDPFELTDIRLVFFLPEQETVSTKGDYGKIHFYYDTFSYDTIYIGAWTQAAGATSRVAYAMIEQKDGMGVKNYTTNEPSGNSSTIKMYSSNSTSVGAGNPWFVYTEKRSYKKIVITSVTGTCQCIVYGKRKV